MRARPRHRHNDRRAAGRVRSTPRSAQSIPSFGADHQETESAAIITSLSHPLQTPLSVAAFYSLTPAYPEKRCTAGSRPARSSSRRGASHTASFGSISARLTPALVTGSGVFHVRDGSGKLRKLRFENLVYRRPPEFEFEHVRRKPIQPFLAIPRLPGGLPRVGTAGTGRTAQEVPLCSPVHYPVSDHHGRISFYSPFLHRRQKMGFLGYCSEKRLPLKTQSKERE